MFDRWYAEALRKRLARPYVHLIFGARQTGKSTLIELLLREADVIRIDFTRSEERSRFLVDPDELIHLCRGLPRRRRPTYIFVDEAQAVPAIFDAVQHLYDGDKRRWRFVLCGSSARKLRLTGANLLPGRSFLHHLYPLTFAERPPAAPRAAYSNSPLPLPWPRGISQDNLFPPADLETRLIYGELPGVVTAPKADRAGILRAYAFVHLEEEMRREALVKDWAAFVRFLRLAALESGQILNYSGISNETGVSQPTVKGYYQLLEDMFIGVRVPAWSKSSRKNLLSTPKFLLFDLGVRHAAAGLEVSRATVLSNPGPLFEQWVGLELWRRLQYLGQGELSYLRTRDGAEIDFLVERKGRVTPIEVKWTERPTLSDARHLIAFLKEHPEQAKQGYIVCRCPRPLALADNIIALPWFCL
ncbi:MAG: ATP-binding protein [Pseudomonadota bacterium]|nr:ATP-binding protein [Pseudomonadota bacterium]